MYLLNYFSCNLSLKKIEYMPSLKLRIKREREEFSFYEEIFFSSEFPLELLVCYARKKKH